MKAIHTLQDIGNIDVFRISLGDDRKQTGTKVNGVGIGLVYGVVHSEPPKNKYS